VATQVKVRKKQLYLLGATKENAIHVESLAIGLETVEEIQMEVETIRRTMEETAIREIIRAVRALLLVTKLRMEMINAIKILSVFTVRKRGTASRTA